MNYQELDDKDDFSVQPSNEEMAQMLDDLLSKMSLSRKTDEKIVYRPTVAQQREMVINFGLWPSFNEPV